MTTTMRQASGQAAARRGAAPLTTLLASMFGFFMITIDVSAVNVGLATIGRDLHTATAGLQWAADSYTLMFAALLLSAGALSDRIGASRAYAAGLAGFTLASAACGLAPSLGVLIAARAGQGCAAAVMLPSSLALVRQAFHDPAARARAIASWTAAGAVAVAAGPVAGGLLITGWSWRGIFLINAPAGLAALALLTRVPRSARRPAALDLPGQLTAVLALGALTFAVIEGGDAGYRAPRVLLALAVALAAAVAFVLSERRAVAPVVPPALFRNRTAVAMIAGGFAANAAFYGIIFVIGLYAQQVLGYPPLAAGLLFVPMAMFITAANVISPRMAARFGPRVPIVTGQVVMLLGSLALLAAGTGPAALLWVPLIPVGIGGGLSVPALTSVLLESAGAGHAGLAGGVFNASRQVGSALAVALFGSLLTGRASFHPGMTASFLVSAAVVAAAAAAVLATRRPSATG